MLQKHPEKGHLGGSLCEIHKTPTNSHLLGLSFIKVSECGQKEWDKSKCLGIHQISENISSWLKCDFKHG